MAQTAHIDCLKLLEQLMQVVCMRLLTGVLKATMKLVFKNAKNHTMLLLIAIFNVSVKQQKKQLKKNL